MYSWFYKEVVHKIIVFYSQLTTLSSSLKSAYKNNNIDGNNEWTTLIALKYQHLQIDL